MVSKTSGGRASARKGRAWLPFSGDVSCLSSAARALHSFALSLSFSLTHIQC